MQKTTQMATHDQSRLYHGIAEKAQAPASETVSEETAIKFTTELPVSGFAAGTLTAFQVTSFILSVIIALQGPAEHSRCQWRSRV